MGLSTRQLWNMKKFYVRYMGRDEKLLQAVAVLPWSHNLLLMNKGLNDSDTLFYAREIIRKGWNRDLLLNALKMQAHLNQATPIDNNFDRGQHCIHLLPPRTTLHDLTLIAVDIA